MTLISDFICEELQPDATVYDFCRGVTEYIRCKVYVPLGLTECLAGHPEERLTASAMSAATRVSTTAHTFALRLGNINIHVVCALFSIKSGNFAGRKRFGLCERLLLEHKYNAVALLATSGKTSYESLADNISMETFLSSFKGYLLGVEYEFK